MEDSLKGRALVAEQGSGPDRWCMFFLVVEEHADSVSMIELPKSVVSGDSSRGTEKPMMPPNGVELQSSAARVLQAKRIHTSADEIQFSCDDRGLVMFGGRRSWNEAGEVQREECILRLWDGKETPFEYH